MFVINQSIKLLFQATVQIKNLPYLGLYIQSIIQKTTIFFHSLVSKLI